MKVKKRIGRDRKGSPGCGRGQVEKYYRKRLKISSSRNPSGPYRPGTSTAERLGFTHNRFKGYIYLTGGCVWVSLVESKAPKKGHFSSFIRGLVAKGYTVKVPCPIGEMPSILKHLGFSESKETNPRNSETVSVWVLNP